MIGFGLIGYGAWGRLHGEAIARAHGARLAAIACRTEATAAAARRDFPEVPVHLDYREVLARPEVEAVDIVLPNHLHAEVGVAALDQGKHVLLEKPLACSVEECDRLIAAARRSGQVLSVGHELRLSAQWGRIKALIDAGEIGEPRYALFGLFRFAYRRGAGGWRYQRDRVGSWILEEPVHAFDLVRWYFDGTGEPLSLHAWADAGAAGPAMPRSFSAVVRFARGGYAVITQTVGGFEYHQVVEVAGTEGAVRGWWSGALDRTREAAFALTVQRRGGATSEEIPVARSGEVFELEEQLARTVSAFRVGRPLVSGEEARKSVVMCIEAERSIREGGPVALRF